jgi:hypothetical protein
VLASRIRRGLRSAAPAFAAVVVVAAAGPFAAPAPAGENPPCEESALEPSADPAAPPACPDPAPTTTVTTTPTFPVEEPTPTTMPAITGPVSTLPSTTGTTTEPVPTETLATTTGDARPATPKTPAATAPLATPIPTVPQNSRPPLRAGPYVFPVVGPTSYVDTWGAARADVSWHHGVDIFAPFGSPVLAVADGVLFSVGWNTIGGRRLWLRDRQGNYFYYAHLSGFSTAAVNGARVRAGTILGYVGNTGDAAGTPYHLHFEIHPVSLLALGYDGAVDPYPYVSKWPPLGGEAAAGIGGAEAPAAGAILLGFTDISNGDLSQGSIHEALTEDALADTLQAEPPLTVAAAPVLKPIPAPSAGDEQVVRELDAAATRPSTLTSASIWDALASCESSGNWGANTGNGFVGGLQFLPQTWSSHGGTLFAASAHLATREQQIAIAQRVLDTQGWRAWPACSARLGLAALALAPAGR